MKRAASPAWIFSRDVLWLAWWQELILNWVASWDTIETLHITSGKTDDCLTWNVPTDLELKRIKLEQLLDPELGQR